MPSDNLIIEINPALLEAMDLPGDKPAVDYFELLGVDRDDPDPAEIDRAVLERSKAIRVWQNSPQHGEEAVALLPMFHRVAAILKDPARRKAYQQELERVLKGEQVDVIEEFRKMVRAALVDGSIDQNSKAELMRYATEHQMDLAEAGRIVKELAASETAVMRARPDLRDDWEVKLAEGGPEAFREKVDAMLMRGHLSPEEIEALIEQGGQYSVAPDEAKQIIRQVRVERFRRMARHVAKEGFINNNQARLLMPKAKALGLSPREAYEILTSYTFTTADQQDLSSMQLTTSSFDAGEIEQFLKKQKTVVYRGKSKAPIWISAAVLVLLAGAGGVAIYFNFMAGPQQSSASYPGRGNGAPNPQNPTVAEPAQTASPTPRPTPGNQVWASQKPDPPGGLLLIDPETATGPAPFEIKIHEVTCAEYQKFLVATLHPNPPLDWGSDFKHPPGQENFPVTGITYEDARAYCRWIATQKKLPAASVRLPRLEEFRTVISAPIQGGRRVDEPGFWKRWGFGKRNLAPVKSNMVDTLFFANGQVYDLIGNVAEWGEDRREDGKRLVLGGDHEMDVDDFNPRTPRYRDPETRSPVIGFRYVIERPQGAGQGS